MSHSAHVPKSAIPVFLGDLEVALEYEFDPGEKEVRYYRDGSGHPGSPPMVIALGVWIAGVEVSPTYFSPDIIEGWERESLQRELEKRA